MKNKIMQMIIESSEVKKAIANEDICSKIETISKKVAFALKNNGKILLAGNGGSASQATHIAAEFTGRYKIERKGLPAISLASDLSAVTAIGNDYGFERIFERQIEALGNKGDVLIALSTSGNSKNIIKGIEKAKERGIFTVSLSGKNGGIMKGISDIEIIVPSDNTPRIQEAHIMIMHIICELSDEMLFGDKK